MFKELKKSKKETLNFEFLNDINFEELNEEEQEYYLAAQEYDSTIDGQISIDLNKHVMLDPDGNILKLNKNDGQIEITQDIDGVETEIENKKTYQKTLTPNPNTIYSN